jgi:hypothetical protein
VLTNSGRISYESDDPDENGNYSDIIRSPYYRHIRKRFNVRRLVCRVCKLKFSSRQETQDHIKREHTRSQQRHN